MILKKRLPLSITPSGKNYEAWRIKPLKSSRQLDFRTLAENIVVYATLAASTHNVQPWEFIIYPNKKTIDFRVDKTKILPESDVTSRESFISLGCALTNMEVAAGHYGFDTSIEYLPRPKDKYLAAKVTLVKSDRVRDIKLFQAITTRSVNRSKYEPQKMVPDEVVAEMRSCIDDPELEFHVVKDMATRLAIATIQEQADLIVLKTNRFRHELAPLMLPNDSPKFIGMPGSGFGLSDEIALKLHRELGAHGRFDADLARGFAVSDRQGIISSPLIGVVSAKKDKPKLWLKAGQAWQKMALIAEHHRVNMAINAALVEVDLLNIALRLRLKTRNRPTVVFRAGYATEARSHSPRIPVEKVTTYKQV